ncbi:MAG: addiction module toxin RelE, partial [Gammaproteobacteria bacterium]|nr:addiction module toxin RelE [Gammaproteobacteria bacterium]
DWRDDIYRDDEDREAWLAVLSQVCERFNWVVHAWCQMMNHYHLLVETVEGHLSRGMRQLNSVYTQRFNCRHDEVGHLCQGRYKAILVQKESYLLELTRYVVLNPLRAGMVAKPEEWPWSSYPATIGINKAPQWLDTEWLLNQFSRHRNSAVSAYRRFIMEGKGIPSPLKLTQHQLLLGDESFVAQHKKAQKPKSLRDVSKAQRRAFTLTLDEYRQRYEIRDEAMANAYYSGAYTMKEIGD